MKRLEYLKGELRHLRDNHNMDEISYNKIDLALDELNEVVYEDNYEKYSSFIRYLIDEVRDAMDGGNLPEDLSDDEVMETVTMISNDDSLFNDFDYGLEELFDSIQDDRSIINPIRIEEER